MSEKTELATQAYEMALHYELDYGGCPQCVLALSVKRGRDRDKLERRGICRVQYRTRPHVRTNQRHKMGGGEDVSSGYGKGSSHQSGGLLDVIGVIFWWMGFVGDLLWVDRSYSLKRRAARSRQLTPKRGC